MTDPKSLLSLMCQPEAVRNICIVAHVDHGKTSVADCLLASNGHLATWMTGQTRYMDTRDDEQERGITMKSSAISLLYSDKSCQFLVNLIDSPGHVDFSSEVSTAIRICDGAVLVVDVVEGVRSQTITVLRQALSEHLKLVLVLNKIDRFVIELQLTPDEGYIRLLRIIETLNSHIVQHHTSKFTEEFEDDLMFNPLKTNVVFASALDGWAFTIEQFVLLISKERHIEPETLRSGMWGDFYLSNKTNKVMPNARDKAKTNMATAIVLQTVWTMIKSAVSKDGVMMKKICSKMKLDFDHKLLDQTDTHMLLKSIMQQWFPLDYALFNAIVTKLPNPAQLSQRRIKTSLMSSVWNFDKLNEESKALAEAFKDCNSSSPTIIAFVCKFMTVPENLTSALPIVSGINSSLV